MNSNLVIKMVEKWHNDTNQKFSYDKIISTIGRGFISVRKKQSVKDLLQAKTSPKNV
jgi:hypothetical protein